MKKRIISLLLVAVLLLAAASCGDSSGGGSTTQEDTYHVLDSLLERPSSLEQSKWFDAKVTFSARVVSEPFDMEITDEEGVMTEHVFQYAGIARNSSNLMLLNVTDLEEKPLEGDYISATGKISSYITYVEEDESEVDELEITLLSYEPLEEKEVDLETGDSYNIKNSKYDGTIKFTRAHKDEDMYHEYIALYYEFTNDREKATKQPIDQFYVTQGDQPLYQDRSVNLGNHIDGNAESLLMGSPTEPGETKLYYMPFNTYDYSPPTDEPIKIVLYNDDFNIVFEHTIELDSVE